MERDTLKANHSSGLGTGAGTNNGLVRSSSESVRHSASAAVVAAAAAAATATTTTTSDFLLQWGSRKRPRCMKVQVKDDAAAVAHNNNNSSSKSTLGRVDRRVMRADKDSASYQTHTTNTNTTNTNSNTSANHHHPPHHHHLQHLHQSGNSNPPNGYLNLRQRPSSPPFPPPQRVLRNSENSSAMRGHTNGGLRGFSSPDRGAHDKRGTNHHNSNNNHHPNNHQTNHHHHHHHNESNKSAASSETAHDSKKGGSSSGSGDAAALPVWPPKFVIALTNKEKEEDFIIFKGSKLPQRPKKRAKMVQRTVNLVSPGAWLCDLTLERYEVREKKISKKRPRGLKAMGSMDSDSE